MSPIIKPWGKVDKAALAELVINGDINIKDVSNPYIDSVRVEYFMHRVKKNFRRNYREFSAAWDLEAAYSGARRCNGGDCACVCSFYYVHLHPSNPPHPLSPPNN